MFKLKNIRVVDELPSQFDESNHISQLILNSPLPEQGSLVTSITGPIAYVINNRVVLFDIQEQTWWTKEAEFTVIKFALENTTKGIECYYTAGSISTFSQKGTVVSIPAQGIDAYEVNLSFN